MSITFSLTPEATAELQRQATAAGQDITTFVQRAVQEKLAEDNEAPAQRTYEQWLSDFQHWVESHPSRNPQFDDSRESIYD